MLADKATPVPGDLNPALPLLCEEAGLERVLLV